MTWRQKSKDTPSSRRHGENLAVPDPNLAATPDKLPDEADPAAYLGDQYVMTEQEHRKKPWKGD